MKRTLIAFCGSIVMLSSCTEKGPPINFGGSNNNSGPDSTSVLPVVPAAQAHNVIVEEFTGARCPNCPAAHDLLNNLEAVNPGRINVMAIHIFNFAQSNPVPGAKYDFRTTKGTDLSTQVYPGVNAMPNAGVDRITDAGSTLLDAKLWSNDINNRLTYASPINMALQSKFDATSGTATITVNVTYTQAVTNAQNLNVAIVEDSMYDRQEDAAFLDSDYISNYLFNNIFRDFISGSVYGDPFLTNLATKEAGRTYQKTYTYAVNAAWVPQHCRIIAYVNNADGDKEIVQSVQTKLSSQ